jgi:hypothetical protein
MRVRWVISQLGFNVLIGDSHRLVKTATAELARNHPNDGICPCATASVFYALVLNPRLLIDNCGDIGHDLISR